MIVCCLLLASAFVVFHCCNSICCFPLLPHLLLPFSVAASFVALFCCISICCFLLLPHHLLPSVASAFVAFLCCRIICCLFLFHQHLCSARCQLVAGRKINPSEVGNQIESLQIHGGDYCNINAATPLTTTSSLFHHYLISPFYHPFMCLLTTIPSLIHLLSQIPFIQNDYCGHH